MHRRAFTLFELLIVISILLALGAIVTVSFLSVGDQAEADIQRAQFDQIDSAMERFRIDMKRYPSEDEGIAVAEIIAGQKGRVNYDAIPGVIYTHPELASVGQTEEQLQNAGIAYSSGSFPFVANGRARAMSETDGFVKILADTESDRILGVHIMGADAGHLIGEAVLAIELGASAKELARPCHAHPTLSEAIKEAALDVDERAIHV